jgi:hypothetical protein
MNPSDLLCVRNPDGSDRWGVWDVGKEEYVQGYINVPKQQAEKCIEEYTQARKSERAQAKQTQVKESSPDHARKTANVRDEL